MIGVKDPDGPNIVYRPIRPSDLQVLVQIHEELFPIRYEMEFFCSVVNGHGIVSWAAVDSSRPGSQSDELIGFVTARLVAARESEIGDIFRWNCLRKDETLVYILTLGVTKPYRNHGIATSLVREVIKYASSLPACRAVYLHVIVYNDPAISFYKKMLFKCVRRISNFYNIKGQHYDSYLFVYYVNGGRSPCSPLSLVRIPLSLPEAHGLWINMGIPNFSNTPCKKKRGSVISGLCHRTQRNLVAPVVAYLQSLFKSLTTKLRKVDRVEEYPKWLKCKETNGLLIMENKRIITADNSVCQCV